MIRNAPGLVGLTVSLTLLAPVTGFSQVAKASGKLVVSGRSGDAPVVSVDGKLYVDITSLARLTNGALSFQDHQVTLTLPGSAAPHNEEPNKNTFSKGFLNAGIEAMTDIREWRVTIAQAVQSNYPITEESVGPYRRAAESRVAMVSAATVTDADRNAFGLISGELANMQKLSDKYVRLRKNLTYVPPDALSDDDLNQQIVSCGHGLASLAASGQFQEVTACR